MTLVREKGRERERKEERLIVCIYERTKILTYNFMHGERRK